MDNYATKDEVSDLVDIPIVTELQGKVNTLIDTDSNKSVRDIAVDVLTETLVSETATEVCYVGFNSGRVDWYSNVRYLGRSVRPVCQ